MGRKPTVCADIRQRRLYGNLISPMMYHVSYNKTTSNEIN